MANIKEATKIIEEVKSGEWGGVIKLQTNPNRDNYHAEVLKYVLYILSKKENGIFSINYIQNEMVYLVLLIRYFGKKPLNNGYYFRKKGDAENFVKQYRETMVSFYSEEERELVTEKDEKIKIIGMNLLLEEDVV